MPIHKWNVYCTLGFRFQLPSYWFDEVIEYINWTVTVHILRFVKWQSWPDFSLPEHIVLKITICPASIVGQCVLYLCVGAFVRPSFETNDVLLETTGSNLIIFYGMFLARPSTKTVYKNCKWFCSKKNEHKVTLNILVWKAKNIFCKRNLWNLSFLEVQDLLLSYCLVIICLASSKLMKQIIALLPNLASPQAFIYFRFMYIVISRF
jgi:hypothetical protein